MSDDLLGQRVGATVRFDSEETEWCAVREWHDQEGSALALSPEARYHALRRPPGDLVGGGGRSFTLLKRRSQLIDENYGLGIYFRTRAAYKALEMTQEALAQECSITPRHLQATLQAGSPSWHDHVWEAVATCALRKLRQGREEANLEEFRTLPFFGPSAVIEFVHWLRTGELPLVSGDVYLKMVEPIPFFEAADSRRELVDGLRDFLSSRGVKNVFVVHHRSMSFGLTALASYICRILMPNEESLVERPFCYIPFSRHVLRQRPFRFADVIGILDAFYAGTSTENVVAPRSGREIRDAIERIRLAMSHRPSVLIFDGCLDVDNRVNFLRRLIADDPLLGVLDSLLYPMVDPTAAWDPSIFYDTRIILLADGPCNQLEVVRFAERELPVPHLREGMLGFLRDNLGETAEVIGRVAWGYLEDETKIGLLDSLVRATRVQGRELDIDRLEADYLTPTDLDLMRLLARTLSQAVETAPDLLIIRLCAISDSGIRHTSLARLLDQWSTIVHSDSLYALATPSGEIHDVVLGVAGRHPWVLVEGPDELIPALDDDTHPLEYPELSPGPVLSGWGRRPICLSIRSAALRKAIIVEMEETVPQNVIRAMHRLSAEECLRQQTVIARHSRWEDSHDLRLVRRSLEGLYHGFKSITVASETSHIELGRLQTILPLESSNVFRRLYGIFYRSELESPPHWELSRVLGGDRIKADLLWLALTAPVTVREGTFLTDGQILVGLCNLLGKCDKGAWLSDEDDILVRDLLAGLARAAYHSGNREVLSRALRLASNVISRKSPVEVVTKSETYTNPDKPFLALRKIAIDEAVIYGVFPGQAVERCWAALQETRFPLEVIGTLRNAAMRLVKVRQHHDAVSAYEAPLISVEQFLSVRPALLVGWADLLCRYADTTTLRVETNDNPNDPTDFTTAFLMFLLAEKMMGAAYAKAPLERNAMISAHATRAFVRICVSLARLRPEEKPYYLKQARRYTDILSRSLVRYPIERASLLVVEATIAKSTDGTPLATPLRLLDEADKQMAAVPGWHRARLRLLLERTRTLREMACSLGAGQSLSRDDLNRAAIKSLLNASAYDANLLRRLSLHYRSGYWNTVAEEEERLTQEICQNVGHIPDHLVGVPGWSVVPVRGGRR